MRLVEQNVLSLSDNPQKYIPWYVVTNFIYLVGVGLRGEGEGEGERKGVKITRNRWTNNTEDPRSTITLSLLLSFTSGFLGDNDCVGNTTYSTYESSLLFSLPLPHPTHASPTLFLPILITSCRETCAQAIYNSNLTHPPNTTFEYGGAHFTIVGFMAEKVKDDRAIEEINR